MKYKKGNEKKQLINKEIVRVRDNKKRELLLIFGFVFTFAALIMFYLWQRLGNVELAYRIEDLKKEYAKEREINYGLKLQMEALSDFERIESCAIKELGMKFPEKDEIIITRPVKIRVESASGDKLAYISGKIRKNAVEEKD